MMGQNAPLASLEMIKTREERLIVQRVVLPSDGSSEAEDTARNLIKYNKGKCEVLKVQARQGR